MKVALGLLSAVLLVVLGGLGLLRSYPKVPVVPIRVKATPELVARGKYLANHVTVCIDCHSQRDWRYYTGPIRPGTVGQGGEAFTSALGFPGNFYARNITPAALATWTDGEVARAITSGVSRTGRPFFPVMPYPAYATLRTSDLFALIAYVRTLAPIEHAVPNSEPEFPMSLILRTMPGPATPSTVDEKDEPAYGRYLVTIAGCAECHTPSENGRKLPGKDFAGGFVFPLPSGGVVRSANITPDLSAGIGSWTREEFISRFKTFARPGAGKVPVKAGQFNTYMPWVMYAGMHEADLGAVYAFLRTVPPVSEKVVVFTPGAPRTTAAK